MLHHHQGYDDNLAALADEWASKCLGGHPDSKVLPQFAGTGQNVALTGGSSRDVLGMATSWFNEVQSYTYDTGACNKTCGHYTQVIL